MKEKIIPASVILLTICISIGISFWTLYPQSIRLDEAQSIWMYTKSIPTSMFLTGQDVLVPLYGLLLHFWMNIFGTGIIAARTLSLIIFVLTVPYLYILARESGNKMVAYVTIVLFSLSPFIVWYSNEARMYTLYLLATTLDHLYFLRMYRSDGKRGKTGFLIATILGLYSHYFFIFLILSQMVFVFAKVFGIIKSQDDFNYSMTTTPFQRYKPLLFSYIKQLIIAFLFFLPWLIYMAYLGFAAYSKPYIAAPTSFDIFQTFVSFIFGFQTNTLQGIFISSWPLLVLLILFLFTQKKRFETNNLEYFMLVTFLPVILMYVVSFIRPIFLSRYLIFVTPTLFFIIASFLLSYSKRISYIFTSLLIAVMLFLLIIQNVSADTPVVENYKGATQYLNNHVQQDDLIAVTSPFTVYPIEYYYTGQAQIQTIPMWNRDAQGPIPPYSLSGLTQQINTDKQTFADIYVVLSYDQGYQQDIINYLDKHYQLLHTQDFSTGLEVRVYKLRYDVPS